MSNNLVLGRGEVYFDRFADGTQSKTGERYLGATPAFSVSAETQELEHYSSERGLRIKDESVTLQIDYTGSLTIENIDKENLSLFFFGTTEDAVLAGSTGESEDFVATPGFFYQLGSTAAKAEGVENVSTVSVLIDPLGANTAATLGVDYNLDAALGRIEVIAGGGIAADAVIRVTYNVEAQTQERVISGSTLIQGAVRFISFNGVGGQRNFYMPKVTLRPNGEFALKGEEWQNMAFNMEILQAGTLANVFASGRGAVA